MLHASSPPPLYPSQTRNCHGGCMFFEQIDTNSAAFLLISRKLTLHIRDVTKFRNKTEVALRKKKGNRNSQETSAVIQNKVLSSEEAHQHMSLPTN
jgi:hypothetical protein